MLRCVCVCVCSVCIWYDMIILTSNRMLADLSILSALFCAWQWIVLLWSALFAFSFKMDFAVDKRLSGDGSFVYRTPAVKTFAEPSIQWIYIRLVYYPILIERPKTFHQTTNRSERENGTRREKNIKHERRIEKFKCDQEWVIVKKRQWILRVHTRTDM